MKKMQQKSGFTLAELLIVVAIIAVLVAVAIPIFSAQLEKSREETDIANMRSAKAGAIALLLSGKQLNGTDKITSDYKVYFDAGSGELVDTKPSRGYGKGTAMDGKTEDFVTTSKKNDTTTIYKREESAVDKVIEVSFAESSTDGTYITLTWVDKAGSATPATPAPAGGD